MLTLLRLCWLVVTLVFLVPHSVYGEKEESAAAAVDDEDDVLNVSLDGNVTAGENEDIELLEGVGGNFTAGESEDTELLEDILDMVVKLKGQNMLRLDNNEIEVISNFLKQLRSTWPRCGRPGIQPRLTKSRIVGGREAVPNSWSWQCRLENYITPRSYVLCGASVISDRFLLTAGHCLYNGKTRRRLNDRKFKVICGDHYRDRIERYEQVRTVFRSFHHELYRFGYSHDNDIAIIQLSSRLTFNKYVQPICLPSFNIAGGFCVTTGWGQTMNTGSNKVLRQVVLPVLTPGLCQRFWTRGLTNNMLCAGLPGARKSACMGDSGGPFVCYVRGRWELHGATSWGHKQCRGKPSVFVRIFRFLSWIRWKTGVS